jgi:hypothetical protein
MKAKSLVSVLVICLMLGMSGLAYAAGLSDTNGHWATTQIDEMVANGYVKGYADGSFKPDRPISRAEFLAIANLAFGKFNQNTKASFSDVYSEDWYYAHVASATVAGYAAGYPDNKFKPNNSITRAEAATMLAKLVKLDTSNTKAAAMFKDFAQIGEWAAGSISALNEKKVMIGYPDGNFKPANLITRAESSLT